MGTSLKGMEDVVLQHLINFIIRAHPTEVLMMYDSTPLLGVYLLEHKFCAASICRLVGNQGHEVLDRAGWTRDRVIKVAYKHGSNSQLVDLELTCLKLLSLP